MTAFSSSVVIVYQQLSINEISSDKTEIEGGVGEQDNSWSRVCGRTSFKCAGIGLIMSQ